MNRSQLEHIIRAASRISGDSEIVIIGSQAIHAQPGVLPPTVLQSMEADVYPRNHPDRADDIDGGIGELSDFHQTFGYYAQGVSPQTAILPAGWQRRLVRLTSPNTEVRPAFASTCMIWRCQNMPQPVKRTLSSTASLYGMASLAGGRSPGGCRQCQSTTSASVLSSTALREILPLPIRAAAPDTLTLHNSKNMHQN
jgi:hypothetical protein